MSVPTESEIDRVINGYNHANDAANYAETIKLDIQLLESENYQMIWSTEYNGPFTPNK